MSRRYTNDSLTTMSKGVLPTGDTLLRREANVKVAVTFLKRMGINIWPANSAEIQTKHFKFVNVRIHPNSLSVWTL